MLFDLVDLDDRRVLEIGSGDGRLTWLYADRTAHVTAVEPFAPAVIKAERNLPGSVASRVTLRRLTFAEFAASTAASAFDVAIFSWSLCCMPRADMVPALEEVRRLLRPGGTAIDIHPVPGSAELEVWQGREVAHAEPARTSELEGELHAEHALAHVMERGSFVLERRADFDFRIFASSTRELRDHLAEADAHEREGREDADGEPDPEPYARIERLMARHGPRARIAYHERGRITRLTPSPRS